MTCPNCNSEVSKNFSVLTKEAGKSERMLLWKCENCEVIFADDFKKDRSYIYGDDYAAWGSAQNKEEEREIAISKKQAFEAQIKGMQGLLDAKGAKVLDIGAGNGYLMECLDRAGFQVWGTEISVSSAKICEKKFPGKINLGELKKAGYSDNFFDVIFLTDVLEHLPDPKDNISETKRILKPGGFLFIISPNGDSITRKILGDNWFQYKYEHIFYYNRKSLNYLLGSFGFKQIRFRNNHKKFSLNYYCAYFRKYSFLGIGRILGLIYPYLPNFIKKTPFSNPITGEFLAIFQKNED